MCSRARVIPVLVTVFGVMACDADIGTRSPVAEPVVQCLLVVGDSVQTAWVEWRVPGDSSFSTLVRPVPPALVQLTLSSPSLGSVAFTAAPGVAGRFEVPAVVEHGRLYRLQGTVAGHALSAATTVPQPLDIQTPQEDTVRIALGSCFAFCEVPFRWVAAGAEQYLYVQSRAGTGGGGAQVTQSGATSDTAGVIVVLQTRSGPDTARLTVFALEEHAASFLLPTTPKSSIAGVFGLFGAASRAERWLVWQ